MSPASVSVTVTTIPGQADHFKVGVGVGAVGEGVNVGEGVKVDEGVSVGKGVEVRIAVGMKAGVTVSVRIGARVKFGLGLFTLRLHAWSRETVIAMKNNGKTNFLNRMIASVPE
jgi:UDP-3-O-[3-hydroxymyristoyl] glucosamine N-acyltransferase